jgi:VanZ family protein
LITKKFSSFISSMFVYRWSWVWPLLWGCIIIVLSLMPGGTGPMKMFGIPHFDKVGHFGMYAIWAFLLYGALARLGQAGAKRVGIPVLLISVIGILLECGQYWFAEGRSFELADMVANCAGAIMGGIVGSRVLKNS